VSLWERREKPVPHRRTRDETRRDDRLPTLASCDCLLFIFRLTIFWQRKTHFRRFAPTPARTKYKTAVSVGLSARIRCAYNLVRPNLLWSFFICKFPIFHFRLGQRRAGSWHHGTMVLSSLTFLSPHSAPNLHRGAPNS